MFRFNGEPAIGLAISMAQGLSGRHFYIRQLRDARISAVVEGFDLDLMQGYARLCASALARAHARSGDPAMIAGYMGASETFDDAIGVFAVAICRPERARLQGVRHGGQRRPHRSHCQCLI
jgi:hypothetical protein